MIGDLQGFRWLCPDLAGCALGAAATSAAAGLDGVGGDEFFGGGVGEQE